MTQALFMATKTPAEGESLVNGVRAVLVNLVSTADAAAIKAAAVSAANLAYSATGDEFHAAYFDATVQIGDLTSGPLNGNKKAYVLDPVAGLIAVTETA